MATSKEIAYRLEMTYKLGMQILVKLYINVNNINLITKLVN